jgi:AcrR family transcriptional regulator
VKSAKPRLRGLRADACRNRRRILLAARDALAELGPDVPLDEIARRAGVGNATVYRRFPDRRELIRQVVLDTARALAEDAEGALEEEADGFQALRRFVHRAAERRAGGVFPLLAEAAFPDDEISMTKERMADALEHILAKATAAGLLRPDVAIGDVMVVLTQFTRPWPGIDYEAVETIAHRHLELLLDGMRAPQASELPGPSLTLAELRRVCARSH